MLRVATIAARVAALATIGSLTFIAPWPGRADGAIDVFAFAATAVCFGVWALAERTSSLRDHIVSLEPYGLALIMVTNSVASVSGAGRNLIFLAAIAGVSAGNDLELVAGWMVLGLGETAVLASGLAAGNSNWLIVAYTVLLFGTFVLGLNRRAHRLQAEQSAVLLANAEKLREERAMVATLDERTRIAREIHDVLAHSLGALGLHIQVARAVLTDQNDVDRVVELLDQAHRMATDGLNETRRAVHALRGDTPPLAEGLALLGEEHQRNHGSRVTFEVTGTPRSLSPDAGLAITRTAQEALVNTAKHAPREPVEIHLDYADAGTSLVVSNHLHRNGTTPERTLGSGLETVNGRYGLAGMRERLLLLDGTLKAGAEGDEWVVVAKVPQ
jgi:signal transduction histidine kinase